LFEIHSNDWIDERIFKICILSNELASVELDEEHTPFWPWWLKKFHLFKIKELRTPFPIQRTMGYTLYIHIDHGSLGRGFFIVIQRNRAGIVGCR
jgi:hypothetical protein